jgi:hypothetical protein
VCTDAVPFPEKKYLSIIFYKNNNNKLCSFSYIFILLK